VEPTCATNALSNRVVSTVDEEECAFLGAQNTRPTTIEMAENPEAEDEGVLWRDRPRALRARRGLLFRHWSTPGQEGDGLTCRQGARRQFASPRMLQWSASRRVAPESRMRYEVFTWLAFFNASQAARGVACPGVRSHPAPVALVGECSIPVT